MRWIAVLALGLALGACDDGTPLDPGIDPEVPVDSTDGDGTFEVELVSVATGLTAPVLVASPPGNARLFVVQQDGRILVMANGNLLPTPFLDLRGTANYAGESGLLGMAFHPRYGENGFFFVHYTDGVFRTHVVRYRVSADPDRADPASASEVLQLQQPFGNHNGGHIEFGPDGTLFIALGDGGSGGDPQGNGQNLGTLLGALLRVDVDAATPYAIPASNPFRNVAGARGEIWAYGLRNPWRFAIDAPSGRIYIADVGQNAFEEVNVARLDAGGLNYGWNIMEGTRCYEANSCQMQGLTQPVLQYGHADGCSITGGLVYRGSDLPGLVGHYVYADYCGGWIRSFLMTAEGPALQRQWDIPGIGQPTSFGRDASGEIYVTVVRSGGLGEVLRVQAK